MGVVLMEQTKAESDDVLRDLMRADYGLGGGRSDAGRPAADPSCC